MSGDAALQLSLDIAPEPEEAVDAQPTGATPPQPVKAGATAEQAAAIDARDRNVFLEAGAGTGKTRVLVDRYCDAVDVDGIPPERILAFTFTEKAAAEMRRRVRVELLRRSREAEAAGDEERCERLETAARSGEGSPITTIHGFCRRLLAATPAAAGLDPGFRVLDADEASRLAGMAFEQALEALAARDDAVAAVAGAFRPDKLRSLVVGAYDDLRSHGHAEPDLPALQIEAFEGKDMEEKPLDPDELEHAQSSYGAIRALLVAFGERFRELKQRRAGVDFDDLQLVSVELLGAGGGIGQAQRERFDHLLVDEFQDTSPLQIALVSALRGPDTRVFTVGDEFQSIYAFRGADLDSFRAQRESAAGGAAEVLALTGSFRSTPAVVAAVNAVGAALLTGFTPLRVGREPDAEAPGVDAASAPGVELLLTPYEAWGDDDAPQLVTAAAEEPPSRVAEARFLARRLRELADDGVDPGSMVLLLRAFTHVDVYVEALEMAGLDPYVVGGRGYWSAQQVEDARRLLACVANPLDDEALFAALASPAAGASPDALWLLRRAAGRGRHVWPALRTAFAPPDPDAESDEAARELLAALDEPDRDALEGFARRLLDLRADTAQLPLDALVERTLAAFDYDLAVLTLHDGQRRAANLMKLVRMAGEYESHESRDLRGFLDWLDARSALRDRESEAASATEDHDGVTVMTVHAAKGLEFGCVAVADLSRSHTLGSGSPPLPMDFRGEDTDLADGAPPAPRVGLRLARAAAQPLTVEGYRSLTDAAAQAESQESGRLIYVAASRAKERLILSSTFKAKEADERDREHPASDSTIRRLMPALGVVWGEEGQSEEVELPAPAARADLDAEFGPQRMRVHFNPPGDAAAAELASLGRERRRAGDDSVSGEEAVAPPMTVLAERGATAARSLSYAALAEYSRCGYRFLTERVLGIALSGVEATAPGSSSGDPALGNAEARMGFGRAMHELLEESALGGWSAPSPGSVESALSRHGVDSGERAEDAAALVDGWLASPLLAELRDATPRPELGFRLALAEGTMLRGTIDLLVDGDIPLILDYKTDRRVPAGDDLPAAYSIQRDLYACAVADAKGAERVRTAYVFLREPERAFTDTYEPADLAAARERIEALVGRIRAGEFAPTDEPHRDLCHDCPARRRLCPHPAEMTERDAAEALSSR
jgi:ATP-dependent helicase/nuclease subunit A